MRTYKTCTSGRRHPGLLIILPPIAKIAANPHVGFVEMSNLKNGGTASAKS